MSFACNRAVVELSQAGNSPNYLTYGVDWMDGLWSLGLWGLWTSLQTRHRHMEKYSTTSFSLAPSLLLSLSLSLSSTLFSYISLAFCLSCLWQIDAARRRNVPMLFSTDYDYRFLQPIACHPQVRSVNVVE